MAAPKILSDQQILAAAAATEWPDFKVGEHVVVLFSVQDPIEGVVKVAPDDRGWIKVLAWLDPADESAGSYEFLALAAATVRKGGEAS